MLPEAWIDWGIHKDYQLPLHPCVYGVPELCMELEQ